MSESIVNDARQWLMFMKRIGGEYWFFPHSSSQENQPCSSCALFRGIHHKQIEASGPCPAELMIAGPFPSSDDMESSRPFAGKDGELLKKMLAAINIGITSVYITHAVKCSPYENGRPGRKEIEACHFFLKTEIERVSPRFILLLGKTAFYSFMGFESDFYSMIGRVHNIKNQRIMAIYSPGFLLTLSGAKERQYKKETWVALQKLQQIMQQERWKLCSSG